VLPDQSALDFAGAVGIDAMLPVRLGHGLGSAVLR